MKKSEKRKKLEITIVESGCLRGRKDRKGISKRKIYRFVEAECCNHMKDFLNEMKSMLQTLIKDIYNFF